MKNATKVIISAIGLVTMLMQSSAVQGVINPYLAAHPNVTAILVGAGSILALIHQPTNGATSGS